MPEGARPTAPELILSIYLGKIILANPNPNGISRGVDILSIGSMGGERNAALAAILSHFIGTATRRGFPFRFKFFKELMRCH